MVTNKSIIDYEIETLERLKEYISEHDETKYPDKLKTSIIDHAIYMIELLGGYLHTVCLYMDYQNHDGWIPCEEALPEEGVDVLTTTIYDSPVEWYVCTDQMTGGRWEHERGKYKVTAWRPLPEPYMEVKRVD